ncbi:hypothetical protein LINPERHAP2_LOCUS37722 [Linum perenne]
MAIAVNPEIWRSGLRHHRRRIPRLQVQRQRLHLIIGGLRMLYRRRGESPTGRSKGSMTSADGKEEEGWRASVVPELPSDRAGERERSRLCWICYWRRRIVRRRQRAIVSEAVGWSEGDRDGIFQNT